MSFLVDLICCENNNIELVGALESHAAIAQGPHQILCLESLSEGMRCMTCYILLVANFFPNVHHRMYEKTLMQYNLSSVFVPIV